MIIYSYSNYIFVPLSNLWQTLNSLAHTLCMWSIFAKHRGGGASRTVATVTLGLSDCPDNFVMSSWHFLHLLDPLWTHVDIVYLFVVISMVFLFNGSMATVWENTNPISLQMIVISTPSNTWSAILSIGLCHIYHTPWDCSKLYLNSNYTPLPLRKVRLDPSAIELDHGFHQSLKLVFFTTKTDGPLEESARWGDIEEFG